jgi:ABC-2 type transport system permease protein
MIVVIRGPDGTVATVLSLIPFFSPILMFARIAMNAAPAWQIIVSLVLTMATIVGLMWIVSRIFRVGILMYGKRPTMTELMKWIRFS